MVGYDELKVTSPYRIKHLEDLRMTWRPNEHGCLYMKGILDDTVPMDAAMRASSGDEIRVYTSDPKESTVFQGLVTSVQTTKVSGVYYIELEGQTGSFQLDVAKRSRSFQHEEMTYADVTRQVLKSYPGYNVIHSLGDDTQIGSPIFQYQETDWELLKRLASHFQSVIVCDILEAKPRLVFGMPQGSSQSLPDDMPYTASKNLKAFQEAGGYDAGFHDTDFFSYEVQSGERFAIGDEVTFRGKRTVISEITGGMKQGQWIYTYRLSRMEGIYRKLAHNDKLTGASLGGKVLDVQGEQVKLHLDIDEEQSQSEACWFPFAPPTGNMMYCMPQVGTQASLYLPDGSGKQAMVVASVRTNGESGQKMSAPEILQALKKLPDSQA